MLAFVRSIVDFLMDDAKKRAPKLIHTIFSNVELFDAAGVTPNEQEAFDTMKMLEGMHFVYRIKKAGPDGDYFNLGQKVFNKLAPNRRDRKFVRSLREPEAGFCITKSKKRTYRMQCTGRKCRFFLDSEKICIQNKFFK
jgi:hypothetical protein